MMLFFCCWKRYYWCGSCGCCCSVAVRGIDVDVAVADILVVVASKPRVWGRGGGIVEISVADVPWLDCLVWMDELHYLSWDS